MFPSLETAWLTGGVIAIGGLYWHFRRGPGPTLDPTAQTVPAPAEPASQVAILARRYQLKPLLSPWERKTLRSLQEQIPAGFYLCPQVRIADFIRINADTGRYPEALNRVSGKSVDFVVMRQRDAMPVAAIELDDRTHAEIRRQDRDRFVNELMEALGIPLMRFTPYVPIDITSVFAEGVPSAGEGVPGPARTGGDSGAHTRRQEIFQRDDDPGRP